MTGDYLRRNLSRWSEQLDASKTGDMPTMDRLMAWLRQHMPTSDETTVTLIHGDYRYVEPTYRYVEPTYRYVEATPASSSSSSSLTRRLSL